MSVDVLPRPTSIQEAWVHYNSPRASIESSADDAISIKCLPRDISKRPKSTPPFSMRMSNNSNNNNANRGKIHRPKTASAALPSDCERVMQLEHEATRRHNLESHLPVKKHKPPPWQRNMETPLVPFLTGPGYILSRSKSKCSMTIKSDEFFDPVHVEETKFRRGDPERDGLIAQLQQQISDLTVYLEEERMNHRHTKQKAEEFLRDRIEALQNQNKDHIRDLEAEHHEDLKKLRLELEEEHGIYKSEAETKITRMKKDIETLQGAFDSYKSSLHEETNEKWHRKEEELRRQYEEQKQAALHEFKTRLIQERNAERAASTKEQQKQIETMRKDHKKELDALIRRFTNVASDIEKLKTTTAQLKETKAELEELRAQHNQTCQQLANVTRQLTDTKIKLIGFEENFQEKVQQVDDKYKQQLNNLMTQNSDLRQMYMKKCGDLFDEQEMSEQSRRERVQSVKEAMQAVIETKHRTEVNMAAADEVLDNHPRQKKDRPLSAPSTKHEAEQAHISAGELDHLFQADDSAYISPEVVIPEDDPEILQLRKNLMNTQESFKSGENMKDKSSDT